MACARRPGRTECTPATRCRWLDPAAKLRTDDVKQATLTQSLDMTDLLHPARLLSDVIAQAFLRNTNSHDTTCVYVDL